MRRIGIHGAGFVPISNMGACPSGAAGNGLLVALQGYWPGNEANGDALDAHTNALHLTDVNTVTSNPGLVYPLARQYTAATVEYHTRVGDDAVLSLGADSDITIYTCVYLDNIANRWLVNKRLIATNAGYQLILFGNRFTFYVFSGAGTGSVQANTLGLPAINTWYRIIGWHDAAANTVNIQVNGGAVDSAVWAGGTANDGGVFRIGETAWASPTFPMNGRIGPTGIWISAAGGGGALSVAKRTLLYADLPYAAFTL